MFKGFKLSKVTFNSNYRDTLREIGLRQHKSHGIQVKRSLDTFFLNHHVLNGSAIARSWFPNVNCHIFLSHSHKDKDDVLVLAGWLKRNFGLNSFIDSCIWGYGNDLIRMLDDKYNRKPNGSYNYEKVLVSSGHVHMMLSTALTSMIDKTECLFFYDTPNSVQAFNSSDKTESPWIYSEIAFSEMVRKKMPKRVVESLEKSKNFSTLEGTMRTKSKLNISYDVNFRHLKEIDIKTLNEWVKYEDSSNPEKALDRLYQLTFPIKKRTLG